MQDQRKVTSASAPDPDSGVSSFSHSFFAWMMFPVTRTYSEKGYFANEELRGKIKLGDGLWRPEEVVLGFEPELQTALRGHVSWRMELLEPRSSNVSNCFSPRTASLNEPSWELHLQICHNVTMAVFLSLLIV